jgi:dTDP-4-amino-4,6-dideoxygalactose transaminase
MVVTANADTDARLRLLRQHGMSVPDTVRLAAADQRQVMQRMLDDGVSTRRGVMNAHREGAYPAGTWRASGPLTRGEQAQDTAVALPLYHDMTDDDQDRVVESLTRAVLGP